MPFLGSTPAEQYKSLAKQTITGDGSTSYTLNRSVTNAYDMEVFINNTRQEPDTSYTASGNTITFTAAVTSSDSCYLIYQGQSVGSINPPANSVGTSQIVNDGVHTANIADTAVTHAKLHTSLDLSSKTLTMPSGHIIQVSHTNITGNTAVATTSQHPTVVNLGSAVSFTPKFSNSKLLVTVDGNMKMNAGAQGCFIGVKRDGTYVDYGASQDAAMFTYMAGTTVNHHQSSSSTAMIDAISTNATSFQLVFCRYGGAGEAEVGNWHGVHLTIQEIAQ